MKLNDSEIAFLKQLAELKASWERAVEEAVGADDPNLTWSSQEAAWLKISRIVRETGSQKEFQIVLSEILGGVIHSALVTLDGGTALAEQTQITLTDEQGREFNRFLHEHWPEYSGEL